MLAGLKIFQSFIGKSLPPTPVSRHTFLFQDSTNMTSLYQRHLMCSQANAFVHGGGYYDFVNSEYHATNDDGSVNDDVDYVSGEIVVNTYTTSSGQQKTEYSFDVDHVLVYTYENGALVAKVDGVSVDPSTIVRSDYRLRRKKISFPLQKTTT